MYLMPRLFGITMYCLIMLIFIIALMVSKKSKFILFIYAIVLAVMAYFYVPSYTADLYRIYNMMEYYVSMPFNEVLSVAVTSETPAAILYYYYIGKTGFPNLLPSITALIYYGNVFSIITRVKRKYKLNRNSVSIIVLFVMAFGQYVQVISGIRNMIAFSIIAKCIYEEFIENKKIISNLWKYVIAILFHQSATIVFIIRIIYEISTFNRTSSKDKAFKVSGIFIIIVLGIKYGQGLFRTVLSSATHYLTRNVYFYFWEFLLTALHILLIIVLMQRYKKLLKSEKNVLCLYRYVKIMIIINLIFIFEYNTFQRFSVLISMLMIPLLGKILKNIEENYKIPFNKNTRVIILLFSIIILLLACVRGNLSALKFFV
ncbi:EpsG family protein [Clostridium disporicum]|uniref:EpsG family protein n=1 Tax=Clostridium disporicum TaxID=84024 RepID=A0A174KZ33_9CLOT|nr:EpsG family protein [Clostridium disporicum]CUP17242.1 Uncharacterised protein [Clostridium disporicum]